MPKKKLHKTNAIPEGGNAFRSFIKSANAKYLHSLDKKTLRQIYDKALAIYSDVSGQISRKEREALYELQQALFGKLDPKLQASLENVGQTLVNKPDKRKKAVDYKLPTSGAVIVKEWKGKKLEVKILKSGFEYEGREYKSLSMLAKEISGYTVSGPIFFGLRKPKAKLAA
jgi:hypothetical protein